MSTRMSGLHVQERFFSVNGKSETVMIIEIQKDEVTVEPVPHTISCICSVFEQRCGLIVCTITGKRKHSSDLPQGGLELPCTYTYFTYVRTTHSSAPSSQGSHASPALDKLLALPLQV